MLDRLGSFRSHFMSKIQNLVGLYYKFYQWLDILIYIIDLLHKDKNLYDNIENIDN